MDIHIAPQSGEQSLRDRLEPGLTACEQAAAGFDRDGEPDPAAIRLLRDTGALLAPFPPEIGGLGLGTTPEGAEACAALLRRIGQASLSLGRIFEGHVNGVRLVARYGTASQSRRLAADAAEGHFSAIWAAESPTAPLALVEGRLRGRKAFASGVGIVTRPVLTVRHLDAEQLVLARLRADFGGEARFDLHGVRSAASAAITLDGIAIETAQLVGTPDDYMRQPEISLGAWRPLAVMLGGLDGLVAALAEDLRRRGRTGDPHQRARFGRAVLLRETVDLWVSRVAQLAEADQDGAAGEQAAAQVKLARIAVEDAVTEAIRLAQRSVGMPGFVRPNPVERLSRDLSTYLRQPAPDMVLDEAAAFYLDGVSPP